MINRCFRIKDVTGREWGTFTVNSETTNYIGEKKIHGYLKPTSSFNEIRNIFLTHEKEMSQKGSAIDTNWKEIVNLSPCLIDDVTNETLDVGGIIFVSDNKLVTCDLPTKQE